MTGQVAPLREPWDRLAAQVAIALIDRDEEAARVLLLNDHQDAAEAALRLGKWLIGNLEYGGTTGPQFREDLASALRRGLMDE